MHWFLHGHLTTAKHSTENHLQIRFKMVNITTMRFMSLKYLQVRMSSVANTEYVQQSFQSQWKKKERNTISDVLVRQIKNGSQSSIPLLTEVTFQWSLVNHLVFQNWYSGH